MNINDKISLARQFADKAFGEKEYNGQRYITHCDAVLEVARRFGYGDNEVIALGCILHDTVEDTDVTSYEIREKFGNDVGETVYLVTDKSKHLPRKERHRLTYPRIRGHFEATCVKLCDRIANCEVGSKNDMYRKEHEYFREAIYIPGEFEEMWKHLNSLLK